MWDVNNLKKIDEFENLDYWTLVKIAEIANRDAEYNKDLENQHEELREEISELEDEVSGLEDNNAELNETIDDFEYLLSKCYQSESIEEVKKHIEQYDERHPYKQSFWGWLDKNKEK